MTRRQIDPTAALTQSGIVIAVGQVRIRRLSNPRLTAEDLARWVEAQYGWAAVHGTARACTGEAVDHWWNRLPDGSVLDSFRDRLGSGGPAPARHISAGDDALGDYPDPGVVVEAPTVVAEADAAGVEPVAVDTAGADAFLAQIGVGDAAPGLSDGDDGLVPVAAGAGSDPVPLPEPAEVEPPVAPRPWFTLDDLERAGRPRRSPPVVVPDASEGRVAPDSQGESSTGPEEEGGKDPAAGGGASEDAALEPVVVADNVAVGMGFGAVASPVGVDPHPRPALHVVPDVGGDDPDAFNWEAPLTGEGFRTPPAADQSLAPTVPALAPVPDLVEPPEEHDAADDDDLGLGGSGGADLDEPDEALSSGVVGWATDRSVAAFSPQDDMGLLDAVSRRDLRRMSARRAYDERQAPPLPVWAEGASGDNGLLAEEGPPAAEAAAAATDVGDPGARLGEDERGEPEAVGQEPALRRRKPWPALALLCIVFALAALPVVGSLTGKYFVVPVQSSTMAPSINMGDLGVARPADSAEIRKGDVVVVRAPLPGAPRVIRRVLDVQASAGRVSLVTKGDASDAADPWVTEASTGVWRVTTTIPAVGRVLLLADLGPVRAVATAVAFISVIVFLRSGGGRGERGLPPGSRRGRRAAESEPVPVTERRRLVGASQ